MTQTINALTSILGETEATYERGTTEIDRAIEKFAADEAYLPRLLDQLTPDERAALDRFAARALHCPEARPDDEEEREAVQRADLLARQGAGMGGYTRPQSRGAA